MPTYAYACTTCEHRFEVHQSFSDTALTQCPECEGRLRKLFNTVGIVFKGSGFYRTDSRAGNRDGDVKAGSGKESAASGESGSNGSESGGSGSKDSGTKESGTKESGSTAASGSGSTAGSGGASKGGSKGTSTATAARGSAA